MKRILCMYNIRTVKGTDVEKKWNNAKNSYMDKTLFILLEKRYFIYTFFACSVSLLYIPYLSVSVCVESIRFHNHHHVWLTITYSDDGDRIFMSMYARCFSVCVLKQAHSIFFFSTRPFFWFLLALIFKELLWNKPRQYLCSLKLHSMCMCIWMCQSRCVL